MKHYELLRGLVESVGWIKNCGAQGRNRKTFLRYKSPTQEGPGYATGQRQVEAMDVRRGKLMQVTEVLLRMQRASSSRVVDHQHEKKCHYIFW